MSKEEDLIEKVSNLALYANLKDMLLWKRCIYMTFEQYTKGEHLNSKIYIHQGVTNNIKSFVVNHVKELANKLPFKKVPKPIYVLLAKKLEYDSADSILPTSCKEAYQDLKSGNLRYNELKEKFKANNGMTVYRQYEKKYDEIEKKYVDDYTKYKDYDVSCFLDKDNKLLDKESPDFDKKIFIYSRLGGENNLEYLKKSSLASYKFQGNFEVIIYVPNLTRDLRYFTSFYDFSNQNKWMNMITNPSSKFLSIIPFKKDYQESIIKQVGSNAYAKNPKFKDIVRGLNLNDEMEYPFIKDMSYICFNMGCTAEYGEDLGEIVPTVGNTYDEQLSNAKAKGPYFPTKCLKTQYYHKHMMNFKIPEILNDYKKGLRQQLMKDVDIFKKNYERVQAGEPPSEGYSSDNIVDVIKGSAARFRNETYKAGTKDTEYSVEYNRKILSELAYRHNAFPGVQEIIFPCFIINDNFLELQGYTHFMPWGNILLKQQYVLSEGDVIKLDEITFTSFSKLWELKYDAENKLSLFNQGRKIRTVVDFNMKAYTKKTLVFENGSLNLYGYDDNDNNDNRFSLFVSKADSISPLSIVIENNGVINVYQNGFNVINSL
jgi:hypothetical protein